MQATEFYVRTQAAGTAIFNLFLIPLVYWLSDLSRGPTPIGRVAIYMVVTCLIMCTAVAYFTGRDTRRAFAEGKLEPGTRTPRGLLGHLPARWLPLGLLLGICSAVVLVPILAGLLAIFVDELPFWGLMLFMTLWASALSGLITALVIRRQLMRWQLSDRQ